MRPKRIVVIQPDGSETEIEPPSRYHIGKIVGGAIEHVRVLRADIENANVYTSMYVNETGLVDGLPRNQKATDIYLANMRRQYPGVPAKEARDRAAKEMWGDIPVIDLTPETVDPDDPHVVGTVIWFDGYTEDEANRALAGARP